MGAWHFQEAGMAVFWRMIFGELAHSAAAIYIALFSCTLSTEILFIFSHCL